MIQDLRSALYRYPTTAVWLLFIGLVILALVSKH